MFDSFMFMLSEIFDTCGLTRNLAWFGTLQV
jgi:hypothetical protein